jgi:hypothetical protein
LAMLLAMCALVTVPTSASAENATRDGVFIHISHGKDDVHWLLMP